MQNFDLWQIWVNIILQDLGSWLSVPMRVITLLGSEEFYMLVMPALYWCIDSALGLRIGIILLLSNGLSMSAKLAFHAPRPYWIDSHVHAFSTEVTYGLPSSHAQDAVSVWGLTAATLKTKAVTVVCVTLILLIGISRIYLGVHFAGDVLLGWLLGLILLIMFLALEPGVTRWIRRLTLRSLLLVCAGSSMILLFTPVLINAGLGSWQIPQDWASRGLEAAPGTPINPRSLDNAFTIAGTWLGLTGGAAWLFRQKGHFQMAAAPQQLLLRYGVGLAGVLIFWYGLGAVFPREATLLGYSLRFFRYVLVGLWISALAPLTFQRFRLLNLVK